MKMKVNTPITPFFIFSCREQGKSAWLRLFFFPGNNDTPKSSLKRRLPEKAHFSGFPVSGNFFYKRVPPCDGLGKTNPFESLSAFGWRSKAYLPGPVGKGLHKCPFRVVIGDKSTHLETSANFSERVGTWVLSRRPRPSCPSTDKALKLTSRLSPVG